LWPRFLHREGHTTAVHQLAQVHDPRPRQTVINVRKLLDTHQLLDAPLPCTFARQLLTLANHPIENR
jgi:hypothetical protein